MIAKCSCEHCGGHIEFEAEHSGAVVACPHCRKETTLEFPKLPPKPKRNFKDLTASISNAFFSMSPGRAIVITLFTCWLLAGLIGICVGAKHHFNPDQLNPFLLVFCLGLAVIAIGICAFIYLLPTYVAYQNDKRNKEAIFVLNILTGWTFIGWVIAIVWAFTKD